MRLEKIFNIPLDDEEIILKRAYISGKKEYWNTPMTFSEYENHIENGEIELTPNAHYYWDESVNKLGGTVPEVVGEANVLITRHRRYSYPVLHNHNYVEIIYIASGNCINLFNGFSFEMTQGDVCIMSPNSIHALSCTNDNSCILNIMMNKDFFDMSFLSALRGGTILVEYIENILYEKTNSPYILFPTGQDKWLEDLSRHLLTETVQKPKAFELSTKLLASEFLLHLVREYEMFAVVPNEKSYSPNNTIISILGYINTNYNKVTLQSTASFFNYSTAYLSRLIHKNTGKTFNQIIKTLQMEHAIDLFSKGKTNLTDVAQEVGCFDSSHLSKKFKSYYGISPTEYIAVNCNNK